MDPRYVRINTPGIVQLPVQFPNRIGSARNAKLPAWAQELLGGMLVYLQGTRGYIAARNGGICRIRMNQPCA
jgi:hypothetical protein